MADRASAADDRMLNTWRIGLQVGLSETITLAGNVYLEISWGLRSNFTTLDCDVNRLSIRPSREPPPGEIKSVSVLAAQMWRHVTKHQAT